MNAAQFISKWCPQGKVSEMEIDLGLYAKDAIEDSQSFRFLEVPHDSSDNEN